MMLPVKSSRKMTVVMPSIARPTILSTRLHMPTNTEMANIITPNHVTICIGCDVKLVTDDAAYFISFTVDHFELPANLFPTS